jgi:catechol 2,3-dioxygenase-like lactoylglutathione lyase family enzyme
MSGKDWTMDWKIELIPVPVSDIDRAKEFYVGKLGFNADHDIVVDENTRFVQLTPPGSACSILLDVNMTTMPAGSLQGIQCVIPDADAALAQLQAAGVEAEGVVDAPWGRFVFFADPDGNRWSLQDLTAIRAAQSQEWTEESGE